MKYEVDGIYSNCDFGWESNEFFVKQGAVRIIGWKLHYLRMTIWPKRYWQPVEPDYQTIHRCIEARCVLKKGK